MQNELEKLAIEHDDRLKVISIKHLIELKNIIKEFSINEKLNNFQKWIVDD